jgi:hypothetical protein
LGYSCTCQRGQIQKEVFEARDSKKYAILLKSIKDRKLKIISKDRLLMANRVLVKCLVCKHKWTPFLSNLRGNHGCPKCSPARRKQKCLDQYGVEHSSQRPEIQKKIRSTMVERYGVEHALQNKNLFDKNLKSAYSYKEYKLGKRIVKIQGSEPMALDYLLSCGYKPKQIECGIGNSKVPDIKYTYKGTTRVYHPDMYIPHSNTIVEVKSYYTNTCDAWVNLLKRRACLKLGYGFKLLVMGRKGLIRERDYARD